MKAAKAKGISIPKNSIFIFFAFIFFATIANAGLINRKLNLDFQTISGDVSRFLVSADENFIVYLADQEVDGIFELYSVPTSGGTPTKISHTLLSNEDVQSDFEISGDSSRVVYRAGPFLANELYSVPIFGGATSKINNPFTGPAPNVAEFAIAPNSGRVAFAQTQDRITDEIYELFSVPLGGGVSVQISGPAVASGSVALSNQNPSFQFSSNSSRIVFRGDLQTLNLEEIFSTPANGIGSLFKLNGILAASWSVADYFIISPDSSTVVYQGRHNGDPGGYNLYSAPITGAATAKLNNPTATQSDEFEDTFIFAPNSSRVVFVQDTSTAGQEIYSATPDGVSTLKLNDPLPSNLADISENFIITPDSSKVIFSGDQITINTDELFSVPIDDSASPTRLCDPLSSTEDIAKGEFDISPDGNTVVFMINTVVFPPTKALYSVPSDASTTMTRLTPPMAPFGSIRSSSSNDIPDLIITDDNSRVIYLADAVTSQVYELFSVLLDGSAAPVKVNATLPLGGDVSGNFFFFRQQVVALNDSDTIFYLADQEADNAVELFQGTVDGDPISKINGELIRSGNIFQFDLSPDDNWAVFKSDTTNLNSYELYSAPIAGGPTIRLSDVLPSASNNIDKFAFSPDSGTIAFVGDMSVVDEQNLYSVPIVGGTPTLLSLVENSGFTPAEAPKFTPDNSTILFIANFDANPGDDIYSVPADGSASAIRLNDPGVASTFGLQNFIISPNGSTVVYKSQQDLDDTIELYSALIDGSASPVKLNSPFLVDRYVGDIAISPDGTRVVYTADQDVDDDVELYSVLIGAGGRQQLNAPLVTDGDVSTIADFQITPDSSTVIFAADQDTNNVVELYSVPIDGSASPKNISAPVSSIRNFFITPDQQKIVFSNFNDVFITNIDGSTSAAQISDTPAAFTSIITMTLSPDGTKVSYRADKDIDGEFNLYVVSITGGDDRKINDQVFPGADAGGLAIFSADSNYIAYVGDIDFIDPEVYINRLDEITPNFKMDTGIQNLGTGSGGVRALRIINAHNSLLYTSQQDILNARELYLSTYAPDISNVKDYYISRGLDPINRDLANVIDAEDFSGNILPGISGLPTGVSMTPANTNGTISASAFAEFSVPNGTYQAILSATDTNSNQTTTTINIIIVDPTKANNTWQLLK